MIRTLQAVTNKHNPAQYTAGEAMTRGMGVAVDYTTGKVKKGTGTVQYFVDVPRNYDGENAVIDLAEKDYEDIASGDPVLLIPVLPAEVYATSEVTKGSLAKGDQMTLTAGKFAAVESGKTGDVIYDGEYSDPTGITMYRVVKA